MRVVPAVLLYFLLAWVVMVVAAFFRTWFLLPDLLLPVILYLFYYYPSVPLWRCLIPVSLLMDLAGQVSFGFHGLLFTITAFVAFPLRPYWQMVSVFEQIAGMICLSIGFQVVRFLLLYMIEGIPAPQGWYWIMLWQMLIFPVMRGVTTWFVLRYLPREAS